MNNLIRFRHVARGIFLKSLFWFTTPLFWPVYWFSPFRNEITSEWSRYYCWRPHLIEDKVYWSTFIEVREQEFGSTSETYTFWREFRPLIPERSS